MGEVYRARDTKLGRDVAIKVLPEEVAQDRERLSRFERKAKLLAALNHPGIATLYGVEEHAGNPFLVTRRQAFGVCGNQSLDGVRYLDTVDRRGRSAAVPTNVLQRAATEVLTGWPLYRLRLGRERTARGLRSTFPERQSKVANFN